MFERICIPPIHPERRLFDLGLLAESLIFYHEVYLVLGATTLQGILQQLGPDILVELISSQNLKVRYVDHILGAITAGKGTPFELYDVGIIHAEKHNLETFAREAFIQATGKAGRGRRLASRFCQAVEPISYADNITRCITNEMQDGSYLEDYIRRRLEGGESGQKFTGLNSLRYRFSLIPGKGFQLHTNIDLAGLSKTGIELSELRDPATVLAQYGTTVADMSLWAQLSAEAAVDSRQADVIKARIEPMLNKYRIIEERISTFQEFVFDDARAIREAINGGTRAFGDILPVLENSQKFKDWLINQPPDNNLLKGYYRETTADSWIDKLPGKMARWFLFTGVGASIDALGGGGIGTGAGILVSAFDSFMLDRIVKGWKPHHFVEGVLKKFVQKS